MHFIACFKWFIIPALHILLIQPLPLLDTMALSMTFSVSRLRLTNKEAMTSNCCLLCIKEVHAQPQGDPRPWIQGLGCKAWGVCHTNKCTNNETSRPGLEQITVQVRGYMQWITYCASCFDCENSEPCHPLEWSWALYRYQIWHCDVCGPNVH